MTSELSELLEDCVFSKIGNELVILGLSSSTTDRLHENKRQLRQAAAAAGFVRVIFGDTQENWNITIRRKVDCTADPSPITQ